MDGESGRGRGRGHWSRSQSSPWNSRAVSHLVHGIDAQTDSLARLPIFTLGLPLGSMLFALLTWIRISSGAGLSTVVVQRQREQRERKGGGDTQEPQDPHQPRPSFEKRSHVGPKLARAQVSQSFFFFPPSSLSLALPPPLHTHPHGPQKKHRYATARKGMRRGWKMESWTDERTWIPFVRIGAWIERHEVGACSYFYRSDVWGHPLPANDTPVRGGMANRVERVTQLSARQGFIFSSFFFCLFSVTNTACWSVRSTTGIGFAFGTGTRLVPFRPSSSRCTILP